MPTSLAFEEHLDALDSAGSRLLSRAVDAGLDAPVPTCPTWDAAALIAHQTMVHRWAAAQVRGDDPNEVLTQTAIRETVAYLPGYYLEGHAALLDALRSAPPDLRAMRFLNDAPAPREFWARRQAHETTIHSVDALAAQLGRWPRADETGVGAALATDGLDELLRGFFTRGQSKLFDGEEYVLAVEPVDTDRRWLLHVAERLTVEPDDRTTSTAEPAATVTGTAVQLYLALWNRGDEITATGRSDVVERWRQTQRVRWS